MAVWYFHRCVTVSSGVDSSSVASPLVSTSQMYWFFADEKVSKRVVIKRNGWRFMNCLRLVILNILKKCTAGIVLTSVQDVQH